MKRWLAFALGTTALLASSAAFPCGAAFGPSITIDPRQDIIVAWKDDVETYVFQPVFCGISTDFGLILPVPAPLLQKPSLTEQQAFTTAAALSAPTRKQKVVQHGGFGCAGGSDGGSKNATVDSTTVVASGRVGFLDWVQLKADTESDFTKWLTDNGYPYSDATANVFSYYVKKGWYFLAFRISQEAAPNGEKICRALGPIALSFPTPTPVVPSRMASARSSNDGGYDLFSWRIFGITRGDAELAFSDGPNKDRVLWYSGAILDGDVPLFSGLAEAGDRLTRLTLSFEVSFYNNSSSNSTDIGLTLAPPHDYRGTEDILVYDDAACSLSRSGRLSHSFLLPLFGLALIGLVCWRRCR
jgi:hypothetical protein